MRLATPSSAYSLAVPTVGPVLAVCAVTAVRAVSAVWLQAKRRATVSLRHFYSGRENGLLGNTPIHPTLGLAYAKPKFRASRP